MTDLHLVRALADADDRLPAADVRPPDRVAPVGCRSCGLPHRAHGIHLIHRFVQAGPPSAHVDAPQPEPPPRAA